MPDSVKTQTGNRLATMGLVVLGALCGILALENHNVRQDQFAMRHAYGTFLARKVKGKPMVEWIRPDSLAVFPSGQGYIACSLMR